MIAAEPDNETRSDALTSSEPYRSGHGRAQLVVFLFLAFIVASLFAAVSNYLQVSLLSEMIAGREFSIEELEANDLRQSAAALIILIVLIANIVAFLFWLHRAYSNLAALGNPKSHLEYSPGWAVGSFFIPLVNIYLPYRIIREVWEKSDPAISTQDDFMFSRPGSAPHILAWWILWIGAGALSRFSGVFSGESQTPETLRWVTQVEILADLLWIVSAILAIMVVKSIDRRQEQRSKNVRYVPHMPPPPPLYTSPPPNSQT